MYTFLRFLLPWLLAAGGRGGFLLRLLLLLFCSSSSRSCHDSPASALAAAYAVSVVSTTYLLASSTSSSRELLAVSTTTNLCTRRSVVCTVWACYVIQYKLPVYKSKSKSKARKPAGSNICSCTCIRPLSGFRERSGSAHRLTKITMRLSRITDVKNDIFSAAEIHAAFKMHLLTPSFSPCSAAFLSCHSTSIGGNKRIMSSKKIIFAVAMIQAVRPQLAWKVLLLQHHFYKIELPINPELRLNLNDMTDYECKKNF